LIRVLAFIARRSDVTRDAFRAHYEDVHVGVALPFLAGTAGYVRHHVREVLHGAPPFDCMTVFDYPDPATLSAVFARTQGPGSATLRADEASFMHTPENFYFAVETGPVWQRQPPALAQVELLVCARRPAGEAAAGFEARFAARALPRLRDALEGACASRACWPRPPRAEGRGYDACVLLGAVGAGELARAAAELERDGTQLVASRVSTHVTPMQ
jgi:hypothetical protein